MTNFMMSLKHKSVYPLWIYVICLFCLKSHPLQGESQPEVLSLYKVTEMKITCTASWFLLSGTAFLQAVEETKLGKKDVVLVRGRVDRPGGILGFIVSFLKLYRGADTFDSYIDIETHLPVQCIEHKRQKDGAKKVTEHIYYDRGKQFVKSLVNGKTLNDVPYDIQDRVSILVDFLHRVNTQKIAIGKTLRANMLATNTNGGIKVSEVVVEVTKMEVVEDSVIYTLTSKKLPDVLKYPTVLSVRLLDDGEKKIPISGVGIIKIPILGKIRIKGIVKVQNAS